MLDFILKYWLEFIFGAVLTGLTFCYNEIKKKLKEQEAIKVGLIAILHDRLCQSCMYFIGKGEVTLTEFKNIEKMYEAYHDLGGNGTGTELYERVRDLKIIK